MEKTLSENGVINVRQFGVLQNMIVNAITTRAQLLKNLMDPRRDIDEECGYPKEISEEQYKRMYLRNGVAQRVVDIWPDECWIENPSILENDEEDLTEFEEAIIELDKSLSLFSYLHRIDKLSGIMGYGVILLGLDDGKKLDEPVDGVNEDGSFKEGLAYDLKYLRVFDQSLAQIASFVTEETNPRYGDPEYYNLTFESLMNVGQSNANTSSSKKVHWSRVVHFCDNRMSSEIQGLSRMQPVWNNLHNIDKIIGASGEGYWRGGFPGISLETLPGFEDIDRTAVRDEMEKYMNSFQRYIANVGLTAKTLQSNITDPKPHLEAQLQVISITTKIPLRILIGSEQAKLASTQDSNNLGKRIMTRREQYLTPFVVNPFVDRLIHLGILPPPEETSDVTGRPVYDTKWPDVATPSELEKAEVASKWVEAIAKYIQSGADQLILPKRFLTEWMDFTDSEAEEIIDEAVEEIERQEAEDAKVREDFESQYPDVPPVDPATGERLPPPPVPPQQPAR